VLPSKPSQTETNALETEIEDVIGQLIDVSVLLRQEGSQQQLEDRSKNFEPRNEHGDSLLDEFVTFVDWMCTRKREGTNDFVPEEFLVQRLRRTITKRWRLIHYLIHHDGRMNLDAQISTPMPEGHIVEHVDRTVDKPQKEVKTFESIPSATKTKRVTWGDRCNPPISRQPKSLSMASSRAQFRAGTSTVPRPLEELTGMRKSECPYCREFVSVKELDRHWRCVAIWKDVDFADNNVEHISHKNFARTSAYSKTARRRTPYIGTPNSGCSTWTTSISPRLGGALFVTSPIKRKSNAPSLAQRILSTMSVANTRESLMQVSSSS
jgi:hypothetical protein